MSGVLFQVRNRRGLGHLVRVRNLATELRHRAPGLAVHAHCSVSPAADVWDPAFSWSDSGRQEWSEVVAELRPEVVVFDTVLPAEPRAGLAAGTRVAFVLRERSADRWQELWDHPGLAHLDRILVPHEAGELATDLPPAVMAITSVVGTIVRRPDAAVVEALRVRLGLGPTTPLLVSTGGGGGFAADTDRFFEVVAEAHRLAAARFSGFRHVIVLGPNHANPGAAADLRVLPGAVVIDTCPHLVELLALADVACTEAGYNTISELRTVAAPSVLVPAPRGLDDQFERAARLAAAGAATVVAARDPIGSAALAVVDLLGDREAQAAQRAAHRAWPIDPGNERAARLILDLLP